MELAMKLLERVCDVGMRRRLAAVTVECYQMWIERFLRFCRVDGRWRDPRELGTTDVEQFLTHLAKDRRLSASSQNQATCAIIFLYKQVLAGEVPEDHLGRFEAERAHRPMRVPTVLSVNEASRLIAEMPEGSTRRLMVQTLYGTGLRVMECCTLRLRDLDFDREQIMVRSGKGDKDRIVMLPRSLREALIEQVRRVRRLHERDLCKGGGYVPIQPALAHKVPRRPTGAGSSCFPASRFAAMSRDADFAGTPIRGF
jgi:site-specific recombinase XerD